MTRLRLPAFLLLAALPGAAWAACNPVGTEDCCTRVVDEECTSADWPRPTGVETSLTEDGRPRFVLVGMPEDPKYRGIRHETWIPVEPRTTCPPDRNDPFEKSIRVFVSWEMTTNQIEVAAGQGTEAVVPVGVTGSVRCDFWVHSFAGVCEDDSVGYMQEATVIEQLKVTGGIVPRHSTNPEGWPELECTVTAKGSENAPVDVTLTGTKILFEPGHVSTTNILVKGSSIFKISGQTQSESMWDARVVATAHTDFENVSTNAPVTVVWVDPLDIQTTQGDALAPDNDAPWKPDPPLLGLQTVVIQSDFTKFETNCSYVVQIRGKVHPSDFSDYAFFTRDCVDSWSFDLKPSGVCCTNEDYQAEPRGTSLSQDDPSPAFSSTKTSDRGYIYDCDTPGMPWSHIKANPSGTKFYRGFNFIENVYVYVDGEEVRASNDFLWHVRLALQSKAIQLDTGKWKWSMSRLSGYGNEAGEGHVNVQGGGAQ